MNLIQIQKKYGNNEKCRAYLEKLRWGKTVTCTKCNSTNVVRLKNQIGRFHCNECKTTFSVISDTIFEESKLPLSTWFIVIGLMLNSKNGISAKEIERNTGITYKTAWYSAMRVRCAMIDHCNIELENIVEMDEAYVGGKPKKKAKGQTNESVPSVSQVETVKRGRGTKKTPVVGIVERNGKVILKVVEKLTTRNLVAMLKENVNTDNALVVTDEFRSYQGFDEIVQHYTIKHSKKEWVKGIMHTNTIEGFWSIVKNSIKGNYKQVSRKYLPMYLIQSQYNYNNRNKIFKGNLFESYLKEAVRTDKPMLDYKPVKPVKEIAYGKCKKTK